MEVGCSMILISICSTAVAGMGWGTALLGFGQCCQISMGGVAATVDHSI